MALLLLYAIIILFFLYWRIITQVEHNNSQEGIHDDNIYAFVHIFARIMSVISTKLSACHCLCLLCCRQETFIIYAAISSEE